VGLIGEGEIGVRGIEDLRESDGRAAALILRESLGLTAREASILVDYVVVEVWALLIVMGCKSYGCKMQKNVLS